MAAQQIGTKVITVDGQQVTVRVFSPGKQPSEIRSCDRGNVQAMMAELEALRKAVADAEKRA